MLRTALTYQNSLPLHRHLLDTLRPWMSPPMRPKATAAVYLCPKHGHRIWDATE